MKRWHLDLILGFVVLGFVLLAAYALSIEFTWSLFFLLMAYSLIDRITDGIREAAGKDIDAAQERKILAEADAIRRRAATK